jgi:hypothetical protein
MKRRLTRFFTMFGWDFLKAAKALPGTLAIGDVFTFMVYNTGAFTVSLVAGAGIFIVNTNTLFWNRTDTRTVTCRVTSVALNAETISVY